MLGRLPELAQRVCAELGESESAYRDAVPRAELQEVVQESLGQILEHAAWRRRLLRRAGGARRDQGVPLDFLLRVSHLDFRILWREMREEARACSIGDEAMLEASHAVGNHRRPHHRADDGFGAARWS